MTIQKVVSLISEPSTGSRTCKNDAILSFLGLCSGAMMAMAMAVSFREGSSNPPI